jgi:hypothetical protein
MRLGTNEAMRQIDEALEDFGEFVKVAQSGEEPPFPESMIWEAGLEARLASTVDRLAPTGSYYLQKVREPAPSQGHPGRITILAGVLRALKYDYEHDYLRRFEELVHAESSASYIDMADDLFRQSYIHAAAVIAGSVLEQHLRQLCMQNGIDVKTPDDKYRKADALNGALSNAGVYSTLDLKGVTNWLGLRNEAAHGNYGAYTQQQVRLLIDGVRDFLLRNPA